MKKLLIIAVSIVPLLFGSSALADNQQRTLRREPITIQLAWSQYGPSISGMNFHSVPTGKIFVVETVSARVLEPGESVPGDPPTVIAAVPAYLRLEVDGTRSFFIPLARQGACAEGGFECGDAVWGTLVGAESVRLYAAQTIEGDIFMMSTSGQAQVLLLVSGYLLPEGSETLGP